MNRAGVLEGTWHQTSAGPQRIECSDLVVLSVYIVGSKKCQILSWRL